MLLLDWLPVDVDGLARLFFDDNAILLCISDFVNDMHNIGYSTESQSAVAHVHFCDTASPARTAHKFSTYSPGCAELSLPRDAMHPRY